eukprot:12922241-Prorocentrum_lima.AAC.1
MLAKRHHDCSVQLQRIVRGFLGRRKALRRRHFLWMQRRHRAATEIQAHVRRMLAKMLAARLTHEAELQRKNLVEEWAAIQVQRYTR